MHVVARLVGVLLACLFLVAPSVDALCRASCTPVASAPSCHDATATPVGPHLSSAASCQREVVIAAPTLDGRRGLVAPLASPAASTAAHLARHAPHRASSLRPVVPAVSAPGCPRSLVLRI